MIEVKIPSPGESITEIEVAQWMKADGDFVKRDDVLCELETEKATLPLTAEADGVLSIKIAEGQVANVGDLIYTLDDSATTSASSTKNAPKAKAKSASANAPTAISDAKPIDIMVPSPGESISEVEIASWAVADGDFVNIDDVLCELETEKATLPLTAEIAGTVSLKAAEGDTLNVGDVLLQITPATGGSVSSTKSSSVSKSEVASIPAVASNAQAGGIPSPSAAKLSREKGIDLSALVGTGKGGRITKADVEDYKPPELSKALAKEAVAENNAPVAPADGRGIRKEKMSKLRKVIARRLVEVKNETAMLTTFNEVDMSAIMKIRKSYQDQFVKKNDFKLGFMSFFTKACAEAMANFPAINASIEGEQIVYHDYVDVGIAVSAPKGLVVPVVRNTESMSLAEIELGIINLAKKARDNKLSMAEMTGGTFTITNGGVFGSMMSTPIINAPQSAILGMHNIVQRAVVVNGEIVIRPMMYLALSYDHRIIDGRESVSFLVNVKNLLEDPVRMLLGV